MFGGRQKQGFGGCVRRWFLTCGHSHGALSALSAPPLNGGHPHSGWPASGACLYPPSASGPCVQSWADGTRTAAIPQSFWPSIAVGTWRCGQTLRAAWVSCRCERTGRLPRSGSQVSRTLWTDPHPWWRTDVWPGTRSPAAAPGSGHPWCCRQGRMWTHRRGQRMLSVQMPLCVEWGSAAATSSLERKTSISTWHASLGGEVFKSP